jgi:hypothetical protein
MQKIRTFGVALAPIALMLLGNLPGAAQSVEVIKEDNHGLSAPMRTMPLDNGSGSRPMVRPRPQIPNSRPVTSAEVGEDGALQDGASLMVSTTPGLNVLGLGNGFPGFTVQYAPPDTNAAVGATQVAETVNVSFAVFDKATGSIAAGPTALNSFWSTVDPSHCGLSGNLSDPVVLYDRMAGRWFIEVITVSSPFKFCVAVSSTSDATGTYHLYTFTDTQGLPDYTKTGVWPDAYYLSARQFNTSLTAYLGPKACAMDRSKMLTGAAATIQCFLDPSTPTSSDGMLPANLDGATLPPAGSPEYFMLLPLPSAGTSTKLQLFKFHVDFTTPANSTFTGPSVITVASYKEASSFNGFVPQLGTTQKLDGLGFSLMHKLSYRNFTGATPHESLVVTHNVSVGTGTSLRYAPRWYEIRSPGSTPVVFQQGSYSPDTTWRWLGSAAMDKVGDIALGYSASSATIHPQIRYTGRTPSTPAGKMQAEATIFSGNGSQTGQGLYRWGDYSSMSIDPVDDCTFWYSNEYIPSNGAFNWSTHLFSFKFTSCH